MKKGRHPRAARFGPVKGDAPETFFRLCHHCLFLNESEFEITKCQKCELKFTPVNKEGFPLVSEEQVFDQVMEEDEEENEEPQETAPPRKKSSLTGLNVKW
ncbi:hypothetical protein EBT16_05750 [bacterium]|nr:hypothetical protein [bacterium]